jgi:hypothetical protein
MLHILADLSVSMASQNKKPNSKVAYQPHGDAPTKEVGGVPLKLQLSPTLITSHAGETLKPVIADMLTAVLRPAPFFATCIV